MRLQPSRRDRGNTLAAVVIFAAILSMMMVSYLMMSENSIALTARSVAWNDALPAAEAGVEEASAAIQSVPAGQSLNAMLPTNGWTASGNTLTKSRAVGNGSYSILITSTNTAAVIGQFNPPIIYSTGYVQVPIQNSLIQRTVQVTTSYKNSQPYSILTKNSVSMSGSCEIDSFDSSNPAYSSNGVYVAALRRDQAQVACASTVAGCISASTIFGYVNTLPGGTVNVNSGAVGDLAYVTNWANNNTIQNGHYGNNLNATFPDVSPPYAFGASLYAATIDGTAYTYVADGPSNYYGGPLTINAGEAMLIRSNVTLFVTGNFTVSSNGYVLITNNASLNLIVGGNSVDIAGGFINGTCYATNCSIQCLPSCTSGNYHSSLPFIGTVNAPEADWTFHSGASASGSFTAQSFNLWGGAKIHYDESLGGVLNGNAYIIASWSEL